MQKCFFACEKRERKKKKTLNDLQHGPVGLRWAVNRTEIFRTVNTIIALVREKTQSKIVLAGPPWKIIPPTLLLECEEHE